MKSPPRAHEEIFAEAKGGARAKVSASVEGGAATRPACDARRVRRRVFVALALTACAGARPPPRVPPDDGRFVIRFAPGASAPFYDLDSMRARVASLGPSAFTVTLRADAVARYVTAPPPATCVALELTAAGAARLRAQASAARRTGAPTGRLADDLDMAVFVVELDGRRLYEGQTWPARGAAAFDTPAMHPQDAPAPGRLLVNPSQGLWTRLGAGGLSPIDRPELRAYFGARGVLVERRRCEPE